MSDSISGAVLDAAKEARTLVFAALGSTAFSVISAISLRDCDLLSGTGAVTLPVLDAQVPTRVFFLAGPAFLLLLFLYVHFNLRRVAEAVTGTTLIPVWPLSELPLRKVGEGRVVSLITNLVVWLAWPAVATILACRVIPLGDRLLGSVNLASVGAAVGLTIWDFFKVRSRSSGPLSTPVVLATVLAVASCMALALLVAFGHLQPAALRAHYTDFRGAELGAIDLSGKSLRGADFSRATLSQASLRRADLREASLIGADVEYVEFCGAILERASFRGARARKAAFRCGSESRKRPYLSLREVNLADADLREVDLAYAALQRLSGSNLSGASFWSGDLRRADLTRAEVTRVNFSEVTANGARFDEARGSQTLFYRSDLKGTSFPRVNLDQPNFEEASLLDANFSEAVLSRARLGRAKLGRAAFQGAQLADADLTDADLSGATYDRFTRFPPGFEPAKHGMREVP